MSMIQSDWRWNQRYGREKLTVYFGDKHTNTKFTTGEWLPTHVRVAHELMTKEKIADSDVEKRFEFVKFNRGKEGQGEGVLKVKLRE